MKNKVTDLIVDNAEKAFDLLLEDGLLKDIPVLGNIVKVLRIKGDISNILYAKKLESFLSSLADSDFDEIILDVEDKEKLEKVGMDLVFIIDKINNIDKPKWVAHAVIGLAKKEYNLDVFERLIYAIDDFIPTLKSTLDVYYRPIEPVEGEGICYVYDGEHPEELANIGLLTRKLESKFTNDGIIPIQYSKSTLGHHLWKIIENA